MSSAIISRRAFLGVALLSFSSLSVFALTKRQNKSLQTQFITGHIDLLSKHHISGFDATGAENFRVALPSNAHSFAVNPSNKNIIVALPGLPGTRAAVVDSSSGEKLTIIKSQKGRHFNGHGCFSPDGLFLFSSENIGETAEGVITVRDGRDFSFIREISGYGIGPHDIRLLPDGITLVVASGGIQTHPDSGKRELNNNRLESALLFIDSRNGKLLMRREIPVPRLSIRHIDIGLNGEVLVACQYKGKKQMPKLVGIQSGKGQIEMLEIDDNDLWQMKNYTASARIASSGIAAVTCPRGDRVTFWDLKDKKFLTSLKIKDASGVEVSVDGKHFIISANVGELYNVDTSNFQSKPLGKVWHNAKWTNHMVKTHA